MACRVVLMGSDAITVPLLELLHRHADVELAGVLSQPDRPHGRGKKLRPNPLAERAEALGYTVHKPEKPGAEVVEWLKAETIDLAFVMAYGHLLSDALLDAPRLGTVNLHASALPKYRGASPVQGALEQGEEHAGVTLMRVVAEMDAGSVADINWVKIAPEDNTLTLEAKLGEATVPLVERNLRGLTSGELVFHEQAHKEASYTRKLRKDDGWLDFTATATILWNRVRAVNPWPGAFFEVDGVRIKVGQAAVGLASGEPGTVLFANKEGVGIATGEGCLVCQELQRPGGKMLPAKDFLNGFTLTPGQLAQGGEMKPIVRK